MRTAQTMAYIMVTLSLQREGEYWVSRCVELGTASFGSTRQEALDRLIEATTLYLNTLEDLDECTGTLAKKGVKVYSEGSDAMRILRPPDVQYIYTKTFRLEAACA